MRKEIKFHVYEVPAPISYLEAKHFKQEAAKDDIQVNVYISGTDRYLSVGNADYKTAAGALAAIRFQQSQIVREVRS